MLTKSAHKSVNTLSCDDSLALLSDPSSYLKNKVDFPKLPSYVFEARDPGYNDPQKALQCANPGRLWRDRKPVGSTSTFLQRLEASNQLFRQIRCLMSRRKKI